jgi:hypothetical protein
MATQGCRTGRRKGLAMAVGGVLSLVQATAAQSPADRFGRTLEIIERESRLLIDPDIPLDQRALIDYGAYTSFFFMAADDPRQNTHILRLTDLNAFLRVNVDGVHQIFVRGRASYFDWNEGDDPDGEGDEWRGPLVERAIYRFDLKRALAAYHGENVDFNIIAQGGRQLVHWGNGLVLSRELDGGMLIGELGNLRLEAIGGKTFRDQVDFDTSRPDFDDKTERLFYGGMLSYDLHGHRPYVYGLVQEDDNKQRMPGVTFGYDSYYIGGGISGPIGDHLVYGLEAAYEGGRGYTNPVLVAPPFPPTLSQGRENIHAWALDARLDYLFSDANNSRLTGELLLASGDNDRLFHTSNTLGGNTAGTDDSAFNGFGLINTGLAFAANVSNLIMARAGASTFPLRSLTLFERLQVGGDVFVFFRLEDGGPIHEEVDGSGHYLGTEADVYANWQVTSDLAVILRYGVFFPGSNLEFDDDPRHFFFTGVTLAF